MEQVTYISTIYVQMLNLWWWIPLVCVTYSTIIVYLLMDDGGRNSISFQRAVQLMLVGTLCLVPYMSKCFPVLSTEFTLQWKIRGKMNFKFYAFVLLITTFLLAPIMAFLVYVLITLDQYAISDVKKKLDN